MANTDAKKISALGACSSPIANNLLVVVGNTAGTKNNFSLTISTLLNNSAANVTVGNSYTLSVNTFVIRNLSTPANSTITVAGGTMWFDANYLYIAVANNTVKRVALSSF